MQPKAFLSYSWTSPGHQTLVKSWADRMMSDGVEIVLDLYELKEGNDKYTFMERMVTDPSVTHVLVISDRVYCEKADTRKAGVGTESQVMAKEIYQKVDQAKFIPIVCEFDDVGEPYIPTFMASRIWIDFSTSEKVNENWEQLIRVLHGKPLHQKPPLGKPPAYITQSDSAPADPVRSKLSALRQAISQGRTGLSRYRNDMLDACRDYADALRVRVHPGTMTGERVLTDFAHLKNARDYIVDWLLLEGADGGSDQSFRDAVMSWLETMLELKSRPSELKSWEENWFDAHELFVYETFLYIVATLLKVGAFTLLHELFTTHYPLPVTDRRYELRFGTFEDFHGASGLIAGPLTPPGKRLLSPTAELIKRHADRTEVPFHSLVEADFLAFLMAAIQPKTRWHPWMLVYTPFGHELPFFLRATQHKHFNKLSQITGISDAKTLREKFAEGLPRFQIERWTPEIWDPTGTILRALNIDKLDTLG